MNPKSQKTREKDLKDFFSAVGDVKAVKLIQSLSKVLFDLSEFPKSIKSNASQKDIKRPIANFKIQHF